MISHCVMHVITHTFPAMNTRFDILLPGIDEDLGDYLFDLIRREVERTEHKLSIFNPDSELSHINRAAFQHPVTLDDEMYYILNHCLEYNRQSMGMFDVTMRPLLEFWKSHEISEETVSTAREIRKQIGTDKIELNWKKKTVQFASDKVMIDLGGLGKGYALLRVKYILKDHNISSAFLSFGESTILGVGNHPYGNGWKAGICDFFDFNSSLYTFDLHEQTLSVSGNSRNILMRKELVKGHIIDPMKAVPMGGMSAVAVVSASVLDAEALSTALYPADEETRKKILINFPNTLAINIEYDEQRKVCIREIK